MFDLIGTSRREKDSLKTAWTEFSKSALHQTIQMMGAHHKKLFVVKLTKASHPNVSSAKSESQKNH